MSNVVVVGAQWGDEGKGKIVDWMCERTQVCVRYQGGKSTGHTLVIGDQEFRLSILPTGIIRDGVFNIIGPGAIIEPWRLLDEIDTMRSRGVMVSPNNLMIAENAALALPVRGQADGTPQSQGISAAHEDKIARRAIRICDLLDPEILPDRVKTLMQHHNALNRGLGLPEVDEVQLLARLQAVGPELAPFTGVVWQKLEEFRCEGKCVLFEGAQGVMLDMDHGTYPHAVAFNTVAPQAATGSGVGTNALHYVFGVAKAYTTRIGDGPMPTEVSGDIAQHLQERGQEFRAKSGRSRRVGWFDAVQVRQAVKVGGIQGIALSKLDVLDGLSEVRLCSSYNLEGQKIHHMPASLSDMRRVKPVYDTLPGWKGSTHQVRSWSDLPEEARQFIRHLERLIGVPVMVMSTSPEREDTIMIRDPFVN